MPETTIVDGFWTVQQTEEDNRDFEHNLALVIGIDTYGNGISSLTTAVNDAKQVGHTLCEKHKYATHLLVDDVTLERLSLIFEQILPQVVGPEDRLLIYFAGHGIALDGDDGPAGYLVLQDSSVNDRLSFLPMSDLHRWLSVLSCRHLLVVLDCCFAGAFRWASTRHVALLPNILHKERYDRFIQSPAWQVLTSAAYDQTALDLLSGDIKRGMIEATDCHSPFAQAFLQALAGAGDLAPKGEGDGVITATELYIYLRDTVEVQADKQANHPQTPGLWPLKKHGKGEYIFLVPDHVLNLPPAPNLTKENNPYRGLQSYERRHARLFFGRNHEVKELAPVVEMNPLTVVLGASGTGKSSLVKAGLLPYLQPLETDEQSVPSRWQILPPMRPGDSPLRTLENLLKELAIAGQDIDNQEDGIALSGSDLPSSLRNKLGRWFSLHPKQQLLLIVDQFEELITLLHDISVRQQFQQLLADILQEHGDNIRIILTLRTDFETQFAKSPLARYWQAGRYIVPPLTQADLRAVIEGPASERVLHFNPPELVDKLIDEVIQTPGALPLLSFTLSEMYIKYLESGSDNRALTQMHYEELGGVIGSLRNRATYEYEQLPGDAYRATMRRIMLRMVSTEGGELARRRVPLSELEYADEKENEQVAFVLSHLVEARLLVRDSADVDEDGTVDPYVEPAHDALVRAWDKLLEWKREVDEYLPLHRRVTQAATEWQNADESSAAGLLWNNDPRLPQLQQVLYRDASEDLQSGNPLKILWLALWPPRQTHGSTTWLNATESDFVRQSTQRRAVLWRRTVGIVLAVMLVLIGLTAFALYSRQVALREERNSKSQAVAAYAQQAIQNKDHDLAIALALDADSIENAPQLADNALAAAAYVPGTQVLFEKHTAVVNGVAFSPDGRYALSGSADKTAYIWDAKTSTVTHQLDATVLLEPVTSVAYSPKGNTALLGLDDGTLILWDTQSGAISLRIASHVQAVSAIAYHPDGLSAFVGYRDGELVLWNLQNGEALLRLEGHEEGIDAVAISPDDNTALSGSRDHSVVMWDLQSGEKLQTFAGHTAPILLIAYVPDADYVVSGSNDRTVRAWDIATGKQMGGFPLNEHTQPVDSIAMAPLGNTLVSGAWDGSMIMWGRPNIRGGSIRTFVGHRSPVVSLAYSPDGRHVLSGSRDGTVRLWDVSGPAQIRRLTIETPLTFNNPTTFYTIDTVDVDPSRRLAVSGGLGALILWNLDSGKVIHRIEEPSQRLSAVALAPDGRTLLSGHRGYLVQWDLETGQDLRRLGDEDGSTIIQIAYGPDSSTVLVASLDGFIRSWNLEREALNWEFQIPNSSVWSVAFSQDGHLAISGSEDRSLILWNLDTCADVCQELWRSMEHLDAVYRVALSPDSKTALSASADRRVILWDLATGEPLRLFEGHTLPVHAVAYSDDGNSIISGSEDKSIRWWDIETGVEIFRFEGHSSQVQNLIFLPAEPENPDAPRLVSRAKDGELIQWRLPLTSTVELETWTRANRYVRPLTCDEQVRYSVFEITEECIQAIGSGQQ